MTEKKKTEAKKPATTQRFSDVAKELGVEVKALLALVDQFVVARPDFKDYVFTDGKKPAASSNFGKIYREEFLAFAADKLPKKAEPAPEPEAEPAAAPATGLALQWLELFPKLPISGMTGSIAANCTLIAIEGDHWLLHLDPAHSALFNATQQRRLNDALNQFHGRTLTLTIELIKPEQETPAQAATRRRINRQREAEDSIHGDPLIQQMMQQFGAVVRQDTIEPVEAPVPQAS